MKRTALFFSILIMTAGISFGLDEPLFAPVLPEIIGQGGAFTANAHGYGALVTNPAGFSMKGGSVTLLSLNVGPYFLPTKEALDGVQALLDGNTSDGVAYLSDIITSNGIGGDINAGIGIVSKGLGLGIIIDGDIFGSGNTQLGTSFDGAVTATGIAGYSLKIGTDALGLNIGGDIRLMHRIKMENISITDLLVNDPSFNVAAGNALAVDLGAILQLGSLSFGLSVRDLGGTQFMYSDFQSVDSDSFDAMGSGDVKDYKIPMSGTVGISYHPDLGHVRFLFDPVISFDYQHIFYAEEENQVSFWSGIHAGTEIKVLRFLKIRAGINQGYATAGIGMKLLFLDINASYYTREMGRYTGSRPNQAFTVETAIRF